MHMSIQKNSFIGTMEEYNRSAVHLAQDPALFVFSHLRWHFVTQRPHHLLTRAAQSRHVYFWEEPWFHEAADPESRGRDGGWLEFLQVDQTPDVTVIRPHFNHGEDATEGQRRLLNRYLSDRGLECFDSWYYTPMALSFTAHLHPRVTIYDCMDELSAFLGAPPELIEREKELFRVADVIFTGGQSIYDAKRSKHSNVHAFPSSIDLPHFAQARTVQSDPPDQAGISHPRVGFFGVLDERFDSALVSEVALLRPHVQFVFLGPIVKIDPAQLPTASNIHYLGSKSYAGLPRYLAGWDAAILPFAMNDSTRFISPTKTPEYLAAGKRGRVDADQGCRYGLRDARPSSDCRRPLQNLPLRLIGHSPQAGTRNGPSASNASWPSLRGIAHGLQCAPKLTRSQIVRSRMFAPLSKLRSSHKFSSASVEPFDYLVVGAGFSGSVVAERLASQLGKRVLVIDKRPHIGGNTYDFYNEDGVLVHRYGPHIFHTSSQKVVDYLSCFTEWRPYEHRVLAQVDGKLLPIPINLDTVNGLYGLNLDSAGMEKFLAERVESRTEIRTSEDIVVSRIGRELYEKFFRNYTRKQWGLDPSELDSCVAGRIPVRFDRDDRYFSDSFQAMPLEGFTRLFERMLAHPNISVALSTDYREVMSGYPFAKVVYTGPIDEFFDHRFGPLPYRSLRFEHRTHDREQFQPAAVVNYPNDHDYTRITEFKHLTGQKHEKTSIVYEYPTDDGEPYYPIPRPENAELYERYRALASATAGVYFCGRLANYRYFNMDQVVAQALHMYRNIAENEAAELSIQIPARMLDGATVASGAAT